jgi:hypothetical protein
MGRVGYLRAETTRSVAPGNPGTQGFLTLGAREHPERSIRVSTDVIRTVKASITDDEM